MRLVALYIIGTALLCAQARASDSIFFSETLYWPAEDSDPRWIELVNAGDEAVKIGGWRVVDFDGNAFEISPETSLPPQNVVTVVFPPTQTDTIDDLSFEGDGAATLYCRESWAKDFMRGRENGIALYSSAVQSASDLVDFVCWGRDNQSDCKIKTDAVDAGFIPSQLVGAYVGNNALPGDDPALQPGGALGRFQFTTKARFEEWCIYRAFEATPRTINPRPAPYICAPFNGAGICLSDEFDFFPVAWRNPGHLYDDARLQVSTNSIFHLPFIDLLIEAETFLCQYFIRPALPAGTYYSRMRFESNKGTSLWTETVKFTLIDEDSSVADWETMK